MLCPPVLAVIHGVEMNVKGGWRGGGVEEEEAEEEGEGKGCFMNDG